MHLKLVLFFCETDLPKVAINELLCMKNVGAQIAMDFN